MNYAIIDSNGIVVNIAVSLYALNNNWIETGDLPVSIGDIYNGSDFYRNGEKVITHEEELHIMLKENQTVLDILLGDME